MNIYKSLKFTYKYTYVTQFLKKNKQFVMKKPLKEIDISESILYYIDHYLENNIKVNFFSYNSSTTSLTQLTNFSHPLYPPYNTYLILVYYDNSLMKKYILFIRYYYIFYTFYPFIINI